VVEELGGVQHRLRRDAGVVEASTARFVHLDDGGLLAELGGADGCVVAAGSAPDHDHFEGFGHVPRLYRTGGAGFGYCGRGRSGI
jgi:hypothetical protein